MNNVDTPATDQPCQHRTVSSSSLGNVTVCPHCAVVHIAIGHVSMRFTTEAFRDLGELVGRAQAKLASLSGRQEEGHNAPSRAQEPEAAPIPSFIMPPVGRIQ